MIFDEIPSELKEHIFSYVTPNEWINTSKVSTEWLELTLGSIMKVESCHLLILDHLAEFINQQRDTNYTWVSLLTLMPILEHLECCENTEDFWRQISPFCHQLKILDLKPRNPAFFNWNKLDIRFNNLVELLWDGTYQGRGFLLNLIAFSPKLEKIEVTNVEINAEWKNKIPNSVKHILLNKAIFEDDTLLNNLFDDASVLKTFCAKQCMFPMTIVPKFFDETRRLKHLEFELEFNDEATLMIIKNALRSCQSLETFKARGVIITDGWRSVIPGNIKSVNFFKMNVQENIRPDFSFDWLFQNYGCLQSLQVRFGTWTGFDSQKFYSTGNLKTLVLDNYMSSYVQGRSESIDLFSEICARMIRGSHLVDVEICKLTIDESWRHIFPPTIKRLKLNDVHLSKEAQLLFSPQFICENPSNIENLMFGKFYGHLPAMDLNAFTIMQRLKELNLNLRLSGECLQSILTNCSALTDLVLHDLESGALTNTPRSLVLPSLRKLHVIEPVDQPALLFAHFPKVRTVDLAIVAPVAPFSAITNPLQVADTVELRIRHLSSDRLRYLVESTDDTRYKYFCLSIVSIQYEEFSFHLTNSLIEACRKLYCSYTFQVNANVLWINNYPTSSLLRSTVTRIPSSMNELLQRYDEIMEPVDLYASPDSDNKEDDD